MEDRKDFMLVTLPSMSIWVDTYKNSEITMNIIPRWEDGNVTYLSVTPPVGEETKLMACQIGDYQFADNVIIEKPKRVVYFLPTEPTLPDTRINCPNTKGNILQTLSSVKSMKLENLKHNDIQKEVERSTMTTVHWYIDKYPTMSGINRIIRDVLCENFKHTPVIKEIDEVYKRIEEIPNEYLETSSIRFENNVYSYDVYSYGEYILSIHQQISDTRFPELKGFDHCNKEVRSTGQLSWIVLPNCATSRPTTVPVRAAATKKKEKEKMKTTPTRMMTRIQKRKLMRKKKKLAEAMEAMQREQEQQK